MYTLETQRCARTSGVRIESARPRETSPLRCDWDWRNATMEYQRASVSIQPEAAPGVSAGALMIDVRGLCKVFGERQVLNDIDFSVKRGECVAVIGPTGSGKSTLIRCLNYLETPTSGTIWIDGKE